MITLLTGDARAVLATLPPASVSAVCTSPPFYGLRSYSTTPVIWGEPAGGCAGHEFPPQAPAPKHVPRKRPELKSGDGKGVGCLSWGERDATTTSGGGAFCATSGCWRGELGSEPTPEAFVADLVEVFRAVRRVLAPGATLAVNLGDSMAGSGKGPTGHNGIGGSGYQERRQGFAEGTRNTPGAHGRVQGIPPKNLLGIPWRFALAMQADGWIWRSVIPWVKRSALPESCRDRPTNALEWWLLFSPTARYFWDSTAIRQPHAEPWRALAHHESKNPHSGRLDDPGNQQVAFTVATREYNPAGRNFRNTDLYFDSLDLQIRDLRAELAHLEAVRANGGPLLSEDGDLLALDVTPKGLKEAHFATFPVDLVTPLIRAMTSERGVCAESGCHAPWERVVEREPMQVRNGAKAGGYGVRTTDNLSGMMVSAPSSTTLGWQPTCTHAGEPIPATVLDPFSGAGSTLIAADRAGRDGIGIELKEEYAAMSTRRIRGDAPLFVEMTT